MAEPFEKWGLTIFPELDWWKVHNKSKHARLSHFPAFTLEKSIAALAGALVVIATAPYEPSARGLAFAMLRHGWLDAEHKRWFMEDFYKGKYPSDAPRDLHGPLYGTSVEHVPMLDPVTSNICFGGADLCTAYVTLSQTGRLVSTPWPRPGLALNNLHR